MISSANSVPTRLPSGRRLYARRSMDGPAYVDFGTDHPAILIDLGEGGLGFQTVAPVNLDHVFHLKLNVSGVSIETYAELTWLNESGKRGGLRFVVLSVDALAQIREWIGVVAYREAGSRTHSAETGGSAGSAQEGVTKELRAAPTQESQAPSVLQNQSRSSECIAGSDAPSSFQAFADAENAHAAGVSPEISNEPEASGDQVLADLDALSVLRFVHDRAEIAVTDSKPPLVASALPEKAVRMPASDFKNALPVPKSKTIPAGVKPEPQFPAASGQDPGRLPSFILQSQKGAQTSPQFENLLGLEERKSKWGARPASRVLTIGIGAAAGALLMLALMAVVPALRTHVQATANPKSSGSNLPDEQVFQVEVADLSNRRWILKSGGEAASPFSNLPPLTGAHGAAAPERGSESAKASRSEDNATPDKPQVKLGLPRPHEPQAAAVPPQVVPPSIFDGITPPIGSVSEQLTAIGQDATGPGIVKPQSPASPRRSALQAAVLVQRVEPVYPQTLLTSGVTGQVRLSVTIGRDGVPTNFKVLNGDPRLADAARTAVSQWRYRPATLGGEPIETQTVITIDFELH